MLVTFYEVLLYENRNKGINSFKVKKVLIFTLRVIWQIIERPKNHNFAIKTELLYCNSLNKNYVKKYVHTLMRLNCKNS